MYQPQKGMLEIYQKILQNRYINCTTYGTPTKYDEQDAIGTQSLSTPIDPTNRNIGTAFRADGTLLTLSFHVHSADIIKIYLYFNGQIIRFFPKDTKLIFTKLFNMDYGDNKNFVKSEEFVEMVKEIKGTVIDKQFEAWSEKYN